MKILREKESKGTIFERNTAAWLNNKFGDNGWKFAQFGGSDNTVLDVGGFKDTDSPEPGNVRAWIECKYGNAQAGQFTLGAGDEDTFVYDEKDLDKPEFAKLANKITELLNKNELKYSNVTTTGNKLNDETLSIDIEDFPADSIQDMLYKLVETDYTDRKCEVVAFGKNIDEPKFAWVRSKDGPGNDIRDIFKIKGIVRIKNNNPAAVFPDDDSLLNRFIDNIGADSYFRVADGKNKGRLFVSFKNKPSNKDFSFDGVNYTLSNKNIPEELVDKLGNNVRAVRIKGEPGKPVVICTLYPKNDSRGISQEDLEKYLKNKIDKHEDLNMARRKNLSEELVLNDVIKLDAGEEEVSTQPDKETEKEINKEFAEKVKDVEEINDAEAPKLSIKVKGLTEKLILEEPSDMLNEDINPYSYDAYSDAVSDLASTVKRLLERTNGIPHEDAIQLCYDAFEEAINDNLEENLEEEVLDEKIPSDLMKAYKKARYSGLPNTDLQNADYREVTPEEALKLYKQDPQSIRLLIGGNLVDFRENGWASLDHRVQWLPRDKQYVSSKGKVTVDTAKIPTKHLLNIADKIYATNENTPEGKKDAELYSQRSQNPESRHPAADVSPSNVLSSRDNTDSYYSDRRRGSFSYYETPLYLNKQLKDRKEELAKWQNMLDTESWPRYYSKEEVEDRIKDIKNTIISTQGKLKDNQARIRYTSSEVKLQDPFRRYLQIKDNLSSMERDVDRAKDKLDTAIKYGAPASRDNRERLEDLKNRLDDTLKRIALVELELEETDEEDAAEVARAEEKYNQALNQYNSAKSELDQLLRKNK